MVTLSSTQESILPKHRARSRPQAPLKIVIAPPSSPTFQKLQKNPEESLVFLPNTELREENSENAVSQQDISCMAKLVLTSTSEYLLWRKGPGAHRCLKGVEVKAGLLTEEVHRSSLFPEKPSDRDSHRKNQEHWHQEA